VSNLSLEQLAALAKAHDEFAGAFLTFKSALRDLQQIKAALRLDWRGPGREPVRDRVHFSFLGRSCRLRLEVSFAAGSFEPLGVVAVEVMDENGVGARVVAVVPFTRSGVFEFAAGDGGPLSMHDAGELERAAANLFGATVPTHSAGA
jgi:hypothetical protein